MAERVTNAVGDAAVREANRTATYPRGTWREAGRVSLFDDWWFARLRVMHRLGVKLGTRGPAEDSLYRQIVARMGVRLAK